MLTITENEYLNLISLSGITDLLHLVKEQVPVSNRAAFTTTVLENSDNCRDFSKPWTEGINAVNEVLKVIPKFKLPSTRRKRIKSSVGHSLDIHEVNNGNLAKAWESTKKTQASNVNMRKNNVTIVINIGCNSGVPTSEKVWSAATALAVAKALILSGRNVEVIAAKRTSKVYNNHKDLLLFFPVKHFKEMLTVEELITPMGDASWFRRYVVPCTDLIDKKRSSRHYGSSESELEIEEQAKEYFHNSLILEFPRTITSKDSALRYIKTLTSFFNGDK